MIQRIKRWWYRFIGVSIRRDFAYMIDTDEYMLEKEAESNDNSGNSGPDLRIVPDD